MPHKGKEQPAASNGQEDSAHCPLPDNSCLIIFTRYPQPGVTKTRLIPALGAEGAASLQRRLTEHTLAQARELQQNISIKVCYTGGSELLMQAWLGSGIIYQPQTEGNLGQRMFQAFQAAFQSGMSHVIIVGIDCPELDATRISAAFQALSQHDLVLGPAADGGYYLIGLRYPLLELFQEIDWGTAQVFQQTVNIAKRLDLSIAYLPTLSDIDRPEDLLILEQILQWELKKSP